MIRDFIGREKFWDCVAFVVPRIIGALIAIWIASSFTSCASGTEWIAAHPLEFNNVTADDAQWLARNPEVADMLDQAAIPQDDRMHFSGNFQRLHDKKTGAAIGWEADAAVKVAWPMHEPSPTPCPANGDNKTARIQALDELKNRMPTPSQIAAQMSSSVTLDEILSPGDDTIRFYSTEAATITGFVIAVKQGGLESCNCHSKIHRDWHIELGPTLKATPRQRVIVEITPNFPLPYVIQDAALGADPRKLVGLKVIVTGMMFFDEEHKQNAFNTNPHGSDLWRATAWEIHPVTKIEIFGSKPLAILRPLVPDQPYPPDPDTPPFDLASWAWPTRNIPTLF